MPIKTISRRDFLKLSAAAVGATIAAFFGIKWYYNHRIPIGDVVIGVGYDKLGENLYEQNIVDIFSSYGTREKIEVAHNIVHDGDSDLGLSPDRAQFYYVSSEPEGIGYELFVVKNTVQGYLEEQITSPELFGGKQVQKTCVTWSPDSNSLYFVAGNVPDGQTLCRIGDDGGNLESLIAGNKDLSLRIKAIIPNGDSLLFTEDELKTGGRVSLNYLDMHQKKATVLLENDRSYHVENSGADLRFTEVSEVRYLADRSIVACLVLDEGMSESGLYRITEDGRIYELAKENYLSLDDVSSSGFISYYFHNGDTYITRVIDSDGNLKMKLEGYQAEFSGDGKYIALFRTLEAGYDLITANINTGKEKSQGTYLDDFRWFKEDVLLIRDQQYKLGFTIGIP